MLDGQISRSEMLKIMVVTMTGSPTSTDSPTFTGSPTLTGSPGLGDRLTTMVPAKSTAVGAGPDGSAVVLGVVGGGAPPVGGGCEGNVVVVVVVVDVVLEVVVVACPGSVPATPTRSALPLTADTVPTPASTTNRHATPTAA